MRHALTAVAAVALAASTGCSLIPGLAALGPKVKVNGKAFVPATQTALVAAGGGNLVAAGGGNYAIFARADETGVAGAKVSFEGGPVAQTDATGKFTMEVGGGTCYKATVSFSLKSGGTANLVGVAPVGLTDTSLELDTAAYLVGSKIAALGKGMDVAKVTDALAKMRKALQSASKVQDFQDQAGAAKAFDAIADADTKAAVNAL